MSDTGSELPKVVDADAVADVVSDEPAAGGAAVEVAESVSDAAVAAQPPSSATNDDSVLADGNVGDQSVTEMDQIITLNDVLDKQKEMDLEYAAVLGGSDHKSCTYATGYIKRQALYACLTCTPEARTDPAQRAGVCLACSYACHAGHDLIELYTKRAFRCDCGTSRILAVRCRLDENKLDANDANRYNQNFSGVYCTCHRPYPDAEDPVEDEMIQCVVCEDWYHCRHLGAERVPSTGDFSEMVCGGCMQQNEFLQHYVAFSVTQTEAALDESKAADETMDESAVVDVETAAADEAKTVAPAAKEDSKDGQFTDEINQCIQDIIEINKSSGMGEDGEQIAAVVDAGIKAAAAADSTDDAPPPTKKQKLNDASEKATVKPTISDEAPTEAAVDDSAAVPACRKPRLPTDAAKPTTSAGATFWPDGWRSHLCVCEVCKMQMQRKRVEFLLDPEDTVRCYEEKGLAKASEQTEDPEFEHAMSALSQLDHGSQVDMIVGYNKLKEKLTDFLRGFVTSKQVVTEADVKRFFRMMREGGEAAQTD